LRRRRSSTQIFGGHLRIGRWGWSGAARIPGGRAWCWCGAVLVHPALGFPPARMVSIAWPGAPGQPCFQHWRRWRVWLAVRQWGSDVRPGAMSTVKLGRCGQIGAGGGGVSPRARAESRRGGRSRSGRRGSSSPSWRIRGGKAEPAMPNFLPSNTRKWRRSFPRKTPARLGPRAWVTAVQKISSPSSWTGPTNLDLRHAGTVPAAPP